MTFRYKNIAYFIFLIVFLVVPFLAKSIDHHFEIFPAVTLPAGSSQCDMENEVIIPVNEIYGIAANGSEKKLNKLMFLKTIRVEFFDRLYARRFGLVPPKTKHLKTTRLNISFTIKSKVTLDDIEVTKRWLRERLIDQNCNDSILILKQKQIIIRKDGSYYEKKQSDNETILDLY